jgi:hypothetical protein
MGMYNFTHYQPLPQTQQQIHMPTPQVQYPYQTLHPQGPSLLYPAVTNMLDSAATRQTHPPVQVAQEDALRAAASTAGIYPAQHDDSGLGASDLLLRTTIDVVSDTMARAKQNLEEEDSV